MSTSARLERAEGAYRRAAKRAEELRVARNRAIREAVRVGELRAIDASRVTGLSRSRISQIVDDQESAREQEPKPARAKARTERRGSTSARQSKTRKGG